MRGSKLLLETREDKMAYVEILLLVRFVACRRYDHHSPGEVPCEDDLCCRCVVFSCQLVDQGVSADRSVACSWFVSYALESGVYAYLLAHRP